MQDVTEVFFHVDPTAFLAHGYVDLGQVFSPNQV